MSCILLDAKSFEALALSLCAHKVHVPSPAARHVPIATVTAWAAFAWNASEANAIAYAHRYCEPTSAHPLEVEHGTLPAFSAWLAAWEGAVVRVASHRSPIALVKLIRCLVYQITDAPFESRALDIGGELDLVSQRIALSIVHRLPAYDSAAWGDEVTP